MDVNRNGPSGEASLPTLLPELLVKIADELPIEDVAALCASDPGLRYLYETGKLGEGVLLRDVGPAMDAPSGVTALQRAREAIGQLPLGVQALWFRRIAERHPGLTRDESSEIAMVWKAAFEPLRSALRKEPSTPERALALADLDIAYFHGRFPLASGVDRRISWWTNKCTAFIFDSRFDSEDKPIDVPIAVWPDMLDALLSRGADFRITHINTLLIRLGNRALARVSDRLAVTIAVSLMRHYLLRDGAIPTYKHIADMMQVRLGVTDAQRRDILNPRIALEFCSSNTASIAMRWAEGDAAFDGLVEAIALTPFVDSIRHLTRDQWRSTTRQQVGQFLKIAEPDVVAAYLDTYGERAGGADSEAIARLTTSYLDLGPDPSYKMALSAFNAVKEAPAIAQPMLMDRWANGLMVRSMPAEHIGAFIEDVNLWRKSIALELTQQNRPDGVARAFVAEVRCLANVCEASDVVMNKRIKALVETAFLSLNIRSLGPMLSLLCESSERGREWIPSASLAPYIGAFLRDHGASAQYLSRPFSRRLCEVASLLFGELPDCAIGLRSKYDVFCDRIGIPHTDRDEMRTVIEDGIASMLPVDVIGLKTFVRSHLVGLGIVEEDAVERIHGKVLERARAIA